MPGSAVFGMNPAGLHRPPEKLPPWMCRHACIRTIVYVYACRHACMCARALARVHACMDVRMHVCLYACAYVRTQVRVYACTCACTCAHIRVSVSSIVEAVGCCAAFPAESKPNHVNVNVYSIGEVCHLAIPVCIHTQSHVCTSEKQTHDPCHACVHMCVCRHTCMHVFTLAYVCICVRAYARVCRVCVCMHCTDVRGSLHILGCRLGAIGYRLGAIA